MSSLGKGRSDFDVEGYEEERSDSGPDTDSARKHDEIDKLQKLQKDLVEAQAKLAEEIEKNERLEFRLSIAQNESKQIKASIRYEVGYHVLNAARSWRAALRLPVALSRIARRRYRNKLKHGRGQAKETFRSVYTVENVQEFLFNFLRFNAETNTSHFKAVIYADVSPNILDGSSIWLSSITNIVSSSRKTLLLLKDNIKNEKVISSIERKSNLLIVEPKDIGFSAPLSVAAAAEALSLVYSHCPQVTSLITRGVDIGYEVQKRKEFGGVFYPYVTDFYEVTDDGFSLDENKIKKLKEIVLNATALLCQTEEIRRKIEDVVGYKFNSAQLPPTIPSNIKSISSVPHVKDDCLRIGYAGKVQPRWGVEELIREVERQISLGKKIQLHIATGKIHGRGKEGADFVKRIRNLLNNDFVELHENLSREAALTLMASMDLVWCYRDPVLEDSTLELSTKLVETAALGKPCIAYSSGINKNFLGDDYPFLINDVRQIEHILENFGLLLRKSERQLQALSESVSDKYSFSSLKSTIDKKLDEQTSTSLSDKKIVVSGHDLKFIFSYISYLRRQGAEVVIDPWEWGRQVSSKITNHYASWADYIFCEWGLANAVWHSKNKIEGKNLSVRVHAQEVRKKAEKFGHNIDATNVDQFIFVSPIIREKAIDLFGWPESKSVVIPNGVKENRFYRGTGVIRPVLGMVGIVPTTKRLDRALNLLRALNERGWDATLFCKGHRPEELPFMLAPGRSQELEYYEKLYHKISTDPYLNSHVVFDAWGNDLERWYQKVDFILSPSDNESFHYALADGVMAGCLPLVWPWNGASDVYTDDWLVGSIDNAVDKVEQLMMLDAQVIEQMKTKNLNLVSEKYNESVIFERLSATSLKSKI